MYTTGALRVWAQTGAELVGVQVPRVAPAAAQPRHTMLASSVLSDSELLLLSSLGRKRREGGMKQGLLLPHGHGPVQSFSERGGRPADPSPSRHLFGGQDWKRQPCSPCRPRLPEDSRPVWA